MRRLVIGLVAFLVLFALVYTVWGGIKHSSTVWNHTVGRSTLRELWEAEMDFCNRDRDDNKVKDFWVGDVSRLYYLEARGERLNLIMRSTADADGAPKGPLQIPQAQSNYRFAAVQTDERGAPYDRGDGRNAAGKFAFCAYPDRYQRNPWYLDEKHGTFYTFIINESKTVWRKDTGGGTPVKQWPRNPAAEGWVRLD